MSVYVRLMTPPDSPSEILRQIALIDRMERGTLCVMRPGPNGPYYNHQFWQEGKHVSRYVPAAQVEPLREAIAGFQRFQALSQQYADQLVAKTRQELAGGVKKKEPGAGRAGLAREQEIQQLTAGFEAAAPNPEAVLDFERLLRAAVLKAGGELFGLLLQGAADRADAAFQPKPGQRRKGRQALVVQGVLGSCQLERDYYHDPAAGEGHCPADAVLGLEGAHTPALARLVCLEGADEAGYQKAELHLAETGGIAISARQIQRLVQRVGDHARAWQARPAEPAPADVPLLYASADGTGVPMRRAELAGRQGRQPDGGAKTRQAYLGCVFTQHKTDAEGHPVRDHQSTTYVSSFGSIDTFGPLLRQEALRRGMGRAARVVLLIDGAASLEKMGRDSFGDAVQIVDFYHALEHAAEVLDALWGKHHPRHARRLAHWTRRLLDDKVGQLVRQTRREAASRPNAPEVLEKLGYFERNTARMQYGTFRRQGYFVGSGVVEAGCKTLIGTRCKQSGMFWSVAGAENVLALRCIHHSGRLDLFWKHRLNHHAARNDPLELSA